MRKLKWLTGLLVFLMLGPMVCSGAGAQTGSRVEDGSAPAKPKTIRHMIILSIEGLTQEGMQAAYTPNINGLAASGISAQAIGVLPADTRTMLTSLLTGASPDVHGLTGPRQHLKTKTLPQIVCDYGRSAAFISYPGATVPQLFSYPGQNKTAAYNVKQKNNEAVVNKAIQVMRERQPYFMGVAMPGVQGLPTGAGTAREMNVVDEQVGRLLGTMRTLGLYDECLFVVVGAYNEQLARSGELLKNPKVNTVPVIMAGPGLKSGMALPPVKVIDVAPTAALLAALQMPPESSGLVLWNGLLAGAGFREENLQLKRINELSEENINFSGQIYRLAEERRLVNVEKQNVHKEKLGIQQAIKAKDRQIIGLKWQFRLLLLTLFITVIIFSLGYVIEYIYLKKKFLMF